MAASEKAAQLPQSEAAPAVGALTDQLLPHLLARASREDVEAYDEATIRRAAESAAALLRQHRRGDSLIAIDPDSGIARQGRKVTTITVVNDNMPFLFDSVMGEITEGGNEALLVMHPVIQVKHGRSGVTEITGEPVATRVDAMADRVSVIHVHIPPLNPARAAGLKSRLEHILKQVRSAVSDWKPMLARLEQAISNYRYSPAPLKKEAVDETVAFLEWLRDDNFTFLGMRDYRYTGDAETGTLKRGDQTGLGILSDPDLLVLRSGTEAVTTTAEVRAFLHGPEPLIVTKANTRSLVHRRAYLDYVGVKTFDSSGQLLGELRIVGLFTSTAYTRSVLKIPYLRSKARAVLAKSGFNPNDHSGKALINVLESYPRDELFQIALPLLRKHAAAILALGERPRVRALLRVDQFDRFVSVIVFVPRDRYDSDVRERIGTYLTGAFQGRLSAFYPAFPEGSLARVHFIIGRSGGKTPKVDPAAIEEAIRGIIRTWQDALEETAQARGAGEELLRVAKGFPPAYRDSFGPEAALDDARRAGMVSAERPIATDFRRREGQAPEQTSLKIFHHASPVALSERVPLLENMGFRVISERTFEIDREDGVKLFLHDMELESRYGQALDLSDGGQLFETVFVSIWTGLSDNDGYNALAQTAGLRARDIAVLRAYGRYLQQAGIPQSPDFVAAALNRYPEIAATLHQLFLCRLDPALAGEAGSAAAEKGVAQKIEAALESVPSLDDDTIIRRFLNLIQSTLRTNHFAPEATNRSLALKFDARAVAGLPAPRPWREIFVYGPEVEGVHLRFGPIARGGLRWSDRAQDYRTEVLGLVKAQQVKNAVIVPVGAKGGFFPKRLPPGGNRDAVFEAGKRAYVNFVGSLLSLTDNLDAGKVIPPPGLVRHDGDDPYFVVAADKGTATFSDTANGISQAHGFWLDDAFASGGSAGYDHKKMGITARGAWEAVKRHFREMNRDIQNEDFTVAGVGDMSGDVFGNGMLLSRHIRLIAAFDHRDIFIDPDPDTATSLAERQRLFELPRSSWQDYDRSKLSPGGGVFSRAMKAIELSAEAAAAIGLAKTTASPAEIMNAILKAPVDLMWFGGIGTYIRATTESDAEVGDRANDLIRVTAPEVRASVIGEGANLGVTQKGRIEYGLKGGRCNSDAIDNSGGVNSSDVEVNIKIALATAMRSGRLDRPARNELLAAMTEEVAALVLRNNYRQTLAISLARLRGIADLPHQTRLMSNLEDRGLLDRKVEALPSEVALAERQARSEPLTRAEIGVLLAYAKLVLLDELVASAVPDMPHLDADLLDYFPGQMAQSYRAEIESHRLRREIIATQLANDVINRGGPTFVSRLRDLTGAPAHEVVEAFVFVRDGFDLPALYSEIDALDNRIDGQVQLDLYQRVGRLIYSRSAWFLKDGDHESHLGARIVRLREARSALEPGLAAMLPPMMKARLEERRQGLAGVGVPDPLADKLALLNVAELIPDIEFVAQLSGASLPASAAALFAVSDALRIGRIEDAARSVTQSDYFDGLALSRASEMISASWRGIAVSALKRFGTTGDPVASWIAAGEERVVQASERLQSLTEGGDITLSRIAVAAGVMGDLASL